MYMLKSGTKRSWGVAEAMPYIYIFGGAVALVFSFLITNEKIELLKNPDYVPPCNINPFISCGTVMATPQASVFGFPNSLLGIAGFAALITIGVVLLTGTKLPRWFWLWLQAGTTLAAAFVYWLFFESVYRIGALCPYCMVVWAMTLPIFWYTAVYNLREGHLTGTNLNLNPGQHVLGMVALYGIIIVAILVHYWSYWERFLHQ